jgi:hypothetical protein
MKSQTRQIVVIQEEIASCELYHWKSKFMEPSLHEISKDENNVNHQLVMYHYNKRKHFTFYISLYKAP